jgi:hypothetical protein
MILLREVFPDIAQKIADGFERMGRPELSAQFKSLEIVSRCTCGDDFCATFYTAPNESWKDRAVETFILDVNVPKLLCVQVVDGLVSCIEMLYRPDVSERLKHVLSDQT